MTTDVRTAYLTNSIATASPARLLVMLLERLVLDVQRAHEAQESGDQSDAHRHFLHAQEIVLELRTSLQVEAFDGGRGLASLYDFLVARLVKANVERDQLITASCLDLARDLCETWRQAALQLSAGT